MPPAQPQGEFQPSHHAVVQGVVTGRQGQPLDSITVVAWRLARGAMVAQTRQPTPVPERAVIRGFAYASRYPRGPQGAWRWTAPPWT